MRPSHSPSIAHCKQAAHSLQPCCSQLTQSPGAQLKLRAASEPLPLKFGAKSPSGAEEGTREEALPLKMSLKTRSFSRDLTMSSDLTAEDLGITTASLPRPGLPSPARPGRRRDEV